MKVFVIIDLHPKKPEQVLAGVLTNPVIAEEVLSGLMCRREQETVGSPGGLRSNDFTMIETNVDELLEPHRGHAQFWLDRLTEKLERQLQGNK